MELFMLLMRGRGCFWHNFETINEGDNGCFMDKEKYRPFEERSGLDGTIEKFCPDNDDYLKKLLPN